MARYTCIYLLATPGDTLLEFLQELFEACQLEVIHIARDYIQAKEPIGQVGYNQLVTAEIFIDRSSNSDQENKINLEVKNKELQFHPNNHCYQTFHLIHKAIINNEKWNILESTQE